MSSIRTTAERIAYKYLDRAFGSAKLQADIEKALRDERDRALADAARQECAFCAGVEGYNATAVKADTDDGYVHRNDPPHGLAGVYCKAPRIRALMSKED